MRSEWRCAGRLPPRSPEGMRLWRNTNDSSAIPTLPGLPRARNSSSSPLPGGRGREGVCMTAPVSKARVTELARGAAR